MPKHPLDYFYVRARRHCKRFRCVAEVVDSDARKRGIRFHCSPDGLVEDSVSEIAGAEYAFVSSDKDWFVPPATSGS